MIDRGASQMRLNTALKDHRITSPSRPTRWTGALLGILLSAAFLYLATRKVSVAQVRAALRDADLL